MANMLLLAALPRQVVSDIQKMTENTVFKTMTAETREECQEALLNSEIVALIINAGMVTADSRLLDVLSFYSNKVQVILYSGEEEPSPDWLQMKSVVGCLKGGPLDPGVFMAYLYNATRLYGLEEKAETLESALRDNQSVSTELDLKNKVLERERNFNESIISSIAYGLMIADPEGSIMMMNEMGKKLFGVTVADFYGMKYQSVVYEELRESLQANAEEVLKTGQTKLVEGRTVRDDLIISYSISLIRDHFENPVGLLFLGRDVTEWEQMTTQLFQAEKLATMGTMLSGIAHELRNPITIINARAQRLLAADKETMGEKLVKAVESIEHQSRRCGDIINNLLDFSRKKVAGFTIVNVNEVMDAALEFLKYEKRFEGIELVRNFKEGCQARCDRSQMEQVFLNLFTNACDAMDNKGKLVLTTEGFENYIKITVRDTGVGIPEEHRKKIFDPFFTTKAAGKGTGLGLAIVYKSIQAHKGRLVVRSKVGEGTTFIILLPKA